MNVALLSGGRVAAAACADPVAREVSGLTAIKRSCAVTVRTTGSASHLGPVSSTSISTRHTPNGDRFMAARLLSIVEFTNSFQPRVLSTSLALALVAAGRRAAYVTDGRVQDSVHFASGIALCQAAGCRVTGLRGQPLSAGASGLVVAADNETHATIVAIIAEHSWGPE